MYTVHVAIVWGAVRHGVLHTLVLSMFMHLFMLFNLWEVTADTDSKSLATGELKVIIHLYESNYLSSACLHLLFKHSVAFHRQLSLIPVRA